MASFKGKSDSSGANIQHGTIQVGLSCKHAREKHSSLFCPTLGEDPCLKRYIYTNIIFLNMGLR
jgi:hypothetical protein